MNKLFEEFKLLSDIDDIDKNTLDVDINHAIDKSNLTAKDIEKALKAEKMRVNANGGIEGDYKDHEGKMPNIKGVTKLPKAKKESLERITLDESMFDEVTTITVPVNVAKRIKTPKDLNDYYAYTEADGGNYTYDFGDEGERIDDLMYGLDYTPGAYDEENIVTILSDLDAEEDVPVEDELKSNPDDKEIITEKDSRN